MTNRFQREIASLDHIVRFVNGALAGYRVKESIVPSVQLVIEELFTNMVKYNHHSVSDVSITIERMDDRLVVTLIDAADRAFDLRTAKEVDITKPIEQRAVGGLGIHLVKKLVDSLEYEFTNGENKITFTKKLER